MQERKNLFVIVQSETVHYRARKALALNLKLAEGLRNKGVTEVFYPSGAQNAKEAARVVGIALGAANREVIPPERAKRQRQTTYGKVIAQDTLDQVRASWMRNAAVIVGENTSLELSKMAKFITPMKEGNMYSLYLDGNGGLRV